jgi:hypothetical protein
MADKKKVDIKRTVSRPKMDKPKTKKIKSPVVEKSKYTMVGKEKPKNKY